MDALKFLALVFITSLLSKAATAQYTCWTALLIKEGHSADERESMSSVDPDEAKIGRGVQIALFNSSMNFKGIQIGLWNKNQKRSLPFINWNFKNQ
jgi:hypothetical protein